MSVQGARISKETAPKIKRDHPVNGGWKGAGTGGLTSPWVLRSRLSRLRLWRRKSRIPLRKKGLFWCGLRPVAPSISSPLGWLSRRSDIGCPCIPQSEILAAYPRVESSLRCVFNRPKAAWSYPNFKRGYAQIKRDYSVNGGWKGTSTHFPKKNILRTKNK
jgi:hypothetical protein